MARAARSKAGVRRDGSKPRTVALRNPRHVVIGRRLEFLMRVVNRETIEDLELHVNASASAIRQWFQGHTMPSSDNMVAISEHYLVSLDYLWCREFAGLSDEQWRMLPEKDVLRPPSAESTKQIRFVAVEHDPLLR